MKKLIALTVLSTVPMFAWSPFKGKTGYVVSVVALAAANVVDFGPKTETFPGITGTFTVAGQHDWHFTAKGVSIGAVVAEMIALRKHPEWEGTFTAANWAGVVGVGTLAAIDQSK